MTICRDLCLKYKCPITFPPVRRYLAGQKRCTACDIFIEYDGSYCPCCGKRLRLKPKRKKHREFLQTFLEKIQEKP